MLNQIILVGRLGKGGIHNGMFTLTQEGLEIPICVSEKIENSVNKSKVKEGDIIGVKAHFAEGCKIVVDKLSLLSSSK